MSHQPPSQGLQQALTDITDQLLNWNCSADECMRTVQMHLIAAALKRHSGNKCHTARRLGIHRNTLERQVKELHLEEYVRGLRGKSGPQMKLFQQPVRKGPQRSGLAQDTLVLNRNSQGRNGTYPQLTHRAGAGNA